MAPIPTLGNMSLVKAPSTSGLPITSAGHLVVDSIHQVVYLSGGDQGVLMYQTRSDTWASVAAAPFFAQSVALADDGATVFLGESSPSYSIFHISNSTPWEFQNGEPEMTRTRVVGRGSGRGTFQPGYPGDQARLGNILATEAFGQVLVGSHRDLQAQHSACLWYLDWSVTGSPATADVKQYVCNCNSQNSSILDGLNNTAQCGQPTGLSWTWNGTKLFVIESKGVLRAVVNVLGQTVITTIYDTSSIVSDQAMDILIHPTVEYVSFGLSLLMGIVVVENYVDPATGIYYPGFLSAGTNFPGADVEGQFWEAVTVQPRGINLDRSTGAIWVSSAVNGQLYKICCLWGAQGQLISDGNSFSGVVPFSQVQPLELLSSEGHRNFTETRYSLNAAFPALFTQCSQFCYLASLNTEDFIWLIPYVAGDVVRVHKETGVMERFDAWPVGQTKMQFSGGVFDEKRDRMWMVPLAHSELAWIDVNTGQIGNCDSSLWPPGNTNPDFRGAFIEGEDNLWLAPGKADSIVRVNMVNCSSENGNSTEWPVGWQVDGSATSGYKFAGALYDGAQHGWFIPRMANMVIQVNLWTGNLTGYMDFPPGFSYGGFGKGRFGGGAFDGETIWMAPVSANMIVGINAASGVMKGVFGPPAAFVAGSFSYAAATFDGKYVWFPPREANMLIRLEVSTDTTTFYDIGWTGTNLDGTFTATLDFASASLWLMSTGSDTTLAKFQAATQTPSPTQTNVDTSTPTAPPTQTSAATSSHVRTLSKTESASSSLSGTSTRSQTQSASQVNTSSASASISETSVEGSSSSHISSGSSSSSSHHHPLSSSSHHASSSSNNNQPSSSISSGSKVSSGAESSSVGNSNGRSSSSPFGSSSARSSSARSSSAIGLSSAFSSSPAPPPALPSPSALLSSHPQGSAMMLMSSSSPTTSLGGQSSPHRSAADANTQIATSSTSSNSGAPHSSTQSDASSSLNTTTVAPIETDFPVPAAQEQTTATVTAGATVASSLASGGSAGAAADVQGLLVVGLSHCSPPLLKGVAKSGKSAVVPWTLQGTGTHLGGLLGCLVLFSGILTLHVVLTAGAFQFLPKKVGGTVEGALGWIRFPGRSFSFVGVLWQGVALETASLLIDPEVPSWEAIIGFFIFLGFLGIPVFLVWTANKLPAEHATFIPIERENAGCFKRTFAPRGFWIVPDPAHQRLKAAYSPFRSTKFSYFHLVVAARSAVLAVVVILVGDAVSCLVSTIFLCVTFFLPWLALMIFRPGVHPVILWGNTLMTWITILVLILSQVDDPIATEATGWLVTGSSCLALLMVVPIFISNHFRKKYKKQWKNAQAAAATAKAGGTSDTTAVLVPPSPDVDSTEEELEVTTQRNAASRQKKYLSANELAMSVPSAWDSPLLLPTNNKRQQQNNGSSNGQLSHAASTFTNSRRGRSQRRRQQSMIRTLGNRSRLQQEQEEEDSEIMGSVELSQTTSNPLLGRFSRK